MNVDRMLKQISTRQFNEWRAYADLEPFDEERADLRAASIVHAVLSSAVIITSRGKKRPRLKLEDCVLKFGDTAVDKPKTVEESRKEVLNTLNILTALFPDQKKEQR